MRLRDKRFWKFEAMMLLSSLFTFMLFVLSVFLFFGRYKILYLFAITPIPLYQIIGGIITWRQCKGNESWKGLFMKQMAFGIITLVALFLLAAIIIIYLSSADLYSVFLVELLMVYSFFVAISSILPAMLCCYLYKRMGDRTGGDG